MSNGDRDLGESARMSPADPEPVEGIASACSMSGLPSRTARSALAAAARRRWAWLLAALVFTALCAWHPALSADSLHYVDIARTIVSHGQAATYHLRVDSRRCPDTDLLWPPGYPYLLSLLMRAGCTDDVAMSLVSAASFGIVAIVILLTIRRDEWALLGIALWLWLIWCSEVIRWAWSEGPFFALVTAAMVCWASGFGGGQARVLCMSVLAGVFAASAALTRYAGITMVPALVFAGATLAGIHRSDRRMCCMALKAGTVAALTCACLVLAWMYRNEVLNGSPLGPLRPPNTGSFRDVLWCLSLGLNKYVVVLLPIAVCMATARPLTGSQWRESGAHGVRLESSIVLLLVWTVIYVVFMVWQEIVTRLNALGDRLLFPAHGAALLIGIAVLDAGYRLGRAQVRRLHTAVLLLVPLLMVPMAQVLKGTVSQTSSDAYEWIEQNVHRDALLIGHGIWWFRYVTGRPVLESGSFLEGKRVCSGREVAAFLERHSAEFPAAYLIVAEKDEEAVVTSYRGAGIETALVHRCAHGGDMSLSSDEPTKMSIWRLMHWPEMTNTRRLQPSRGETGRRSEP